MHYRNMEVTIDNFHLVLSITLFSKKIKEYWNRGFAASTATEIIISLTPYHCCELVQRHLRYCIERDLDYFNNPDYLKSYINSYFDSIKKCDTLLKEETGFGFLRGRYQ